MIKMVVVKQQNLGSWSLRFTQSHATRKNGPWKAPVIDFNPLENWIDSASGLPNQIVLGPIESQPAHQRSLRLTRGSSRFDIIAAPISADHHQDLPPDGPKKKRCNWKSTSQSSRSFTAMHRLVVYLPEKYDESSVGVTTFLICQYDGKVIQNSMVPVTTNQLYIIYIIYPLVMTNIAIENHHF